MKARAEITHVFNLEKCIRCLNYSAGCPLGGSAIDMQAIRACAESRRPSAADAAPARQPGPDPQVS